MVKMLHALYVALLILCCVVVCTWISRSGMSYYTASEEERPFHPQYDLLKPSGLYSHGYGVVGSAMIIVGVAMYSSRKRIRALAGLGKLKYHLEFHIFLCLLGPLLVLFHTTFKFGGLVSVSFWSMAAVVLSGVVGRYFYVQIPKGIHGNELSMAELEKENAALSAELLEHFGQDLLRRIDALAIPPSSAARMSVIEALNFFVINDLTRRLRLRRLFAAMDRERLRAGTFARVRHLANRRIILTRRIAFLVQFRRIFYYWHVVHLPFAMVMFLILFIHVGVAVAFGYTWIF